jgi:hypothetical protein
MKTYNIISPDGFSIHPTETYTDNNLLTKFNQWKSNYKQQGYYSSTKYGRIPLESLEDYCQVIEIKQNKLR